MKKGEQIMVGGIVLISLYMVLTAFSFPSQAGLMPKIVGGTTVAFGILILVQNQISLNIKSSQTDELSSIDNDVRDKLDEAEIDEAAGGSELGWSTNEIVLIVLIGGYAIVGVSIGIFWVTPLFVLLFLRWRNHSWIEAIVFAGISVLIPYFMMTFLNIDYMNGLFFGGI